MEFSHHPGTDDFSAAFIDLHTQDISSSFGCNSYVGTDELPRGNRRGVPWGDAPVYHCLHFRRARPMRVGSSTAHDCGVGSSFGKGKDPRAGGDCYFVWSVQCSQTSS